MRMIVAKDLNNAIGKNGTLPWRQRWDLMNFKLLTSGGTILMGRKTYESIGKPLPNRLNLVMSRDVTLHIPGCVVIQTFEEAETIDPHLFVIGGQEIYEQALPLCDEIYVTTIRTRIKDADAFFPLLDWFKWTSVHHKGYLRGDNDEFDFDYTHLIRI